MAVTGPDLASGPVTVVNLSDLSQARRQSQAGAAAAWNNIGPKARQDRSRLVDQALQSLWHQALASCEIVPDAAITSARDGLDLVPGIAPDAATGAGPAGLALAAVGSLGRLELGPRSDLDLVLLHDGSTPSDQLEALASALWYPIWDAGFDLDHSVRSLAQCRQVAAGDLAALTGLLGMRPIAGQVQLAEQAASLTLADWRKSARRRLGELAEQLAERTHLHGELAYLIEPDIKEARGGLRDATVLTALAASWLTDRPHGMVDTAWSALLDGRDAIQAVTGRSTHKLLLADQDEVAATLRWGDADDLLARLAEAARVISYSLDTTLGRAQRAVSKTVFKPFIIRGRRSRPRWTVLVPGLVEHDGEIVLAGLSAPQADGQLALEAAVLSVRQGLPIAPLTAAHLADGAIPPVPWPRPALDLLLQVLAAGPELIPLWETLDQAGLITRWLPGWQAIRNRPQRTIIHRHTVDRHLIQTVVEVNAIIDSPGGGALSDGNTRQTTTGSAGRETASGAEEKLSKTELLLLAALFHDLGKLPGVTDHSAAGAELIPELSCHLGLHRSDAADLQLLIGEHLTLANLATTRDPTDPATARDLADRINYRRDLLDLLRALTEADARAAGPKAWTPWRASLVDQLAAATGQLLAD